MVDESVKKSTFSFLQDIGKLNSPLLVSTINQSIGNLAKLNTSTLASTINQSIANLAKLNTPTLASTINQSITNLGSAFAALNMSSLVQKQMSAFSEIFKTFDWEKFERAYRDSMIREFAKLRDERVTAILGQVLTEFWLNLFIKTIFSNSKQIQKMSFDNKRKILEGLGVIDGGMSSDLKLLDDIRAEYAHNFVVDKKEVLKNLEKINRYKNLIKGKKISKRNGNNVRIRKTAIELLFDLIDIEEKYVIEVQKISKAQKAKKLKKI